MRLKVNWESMEDRAKNASVAPTLAALEAAGHKRRRKELKRIEQAKRCQSRPK